MSWWLKSIYVCTWTKKKTWRTTVSQIASVWMGGPWCTIHDAVTHNALQMCRPSPHVRSQSDHVTEGSDSSERHKSMNVFREWKYFYTENEVLWWMITALRNYIGCDGFTPYMPCAVIFCQYLQNSYCKHSYFWTCYLNKLFSKSQFPYFYYVSFGQFAVHHSSCISF